MLRKQTLPRAARLNSRQDFLRALRARSAQRSSHFELRVRVNQAGSARLGVVVAKRWAKQAVLRNWIKRIVREQFRRVRTTLPAVDLVFRIYVPTTRGDSDLLVKEVRELLQTQR